MDKKTVDERNATAIGMSLDALHAEVAELRVRQDTFDRELATQRELLAKMQQFIGETVQRIAGSGPTVMDPRFEERLEALEAAR